MFSASKPSQPSQAFVSATFSVVPSQSGWASEMDGVAIGCESAVPALQIASWGQEGGKCHPGGRGGFLNRLPGDRQAG